MLRAPGSLIDVSRKIYPMFGGEFKSTASEWVFPSGAVIAFRHLQYNESHYDYQGAQLTFIGFDETTHFQEESIFYLSSRLRSQAKFNAWMRATCNPDADSWVAQLIDWWIDERTGYPIDERSGILRYFYRINGVLHWADTAEELEESFPDMSAIAPPKSFTFINASVYDNPALLKQNPKYLSDLLSLHPVEMERLLKGNWKVKYEAGKVFNRAWFEIIEPEVLTTYPNELPYYRDRVRFWDMAATAKELNKDACYTCGILMERIPVYEDDPYYVIWDMQAEQLSPAEGDALIVQQAAIDGKDVLLRWELEGGSSGLKVESYLKDKLSGYDAEGVRPRGDKLTRAKPFATEAKNGRVKLIRGAWNNDFLRWYHAFDGTNGKDKVNDPIDAGSGAYEVLQEGNAGWLRSV